MPTIRCKLVGQSFNKGARALEAQLQPGSQILLVREPDNGYDRNAVEVYVRLGHVNRESAAVLADLFDPGHTALRPKCWTIRADLGNLEDHSIEVYIPEPRSPRDPNAPIGDDEIPF